MNVPGPPAIPPPLGLLAELTHRCPLGCPYCSNPVDLERRNAELDTATWQRVLREAAALGVLQLHLSGGEPAARPDLEAITATATEVGLYANLITSGVLLDAARLKALAAAGLPHVQLSIQHADAQAADRIARFRGAHARKLALAEAVHAAGMALTVNAVLHRENVDALEAMIALAERMGATRLEVAHTQYHGWALRNRAALMPDASQVARSRQIVAGAERRLAGRMAIDFVTPDYHASRPKACMGGWGRRFLNVTPSGAVLPCHAAESIPGLSFDRVTERSLEQIWYGSAAFNRFRGTGWMSEPCRSCERRELDWGGCRCQALALTGDAARTDPACALSPDRRRLDEALAVMPAEGFAWRRP
ncbi:pyrroloquinoline quinone biosynthesis protein PqqE [Roseomonas sp. KE0001]|uniref:pyrroloquinoline quinone biosynthesis protein PqqE n=1 Tax=Roseomonas sp. KE0001 TaxID=2479201 RepID=UPI0018E0156D|nr:pyrroloquinoline quinone biosynthesis protein PqqE [Roseomonas sp. KE0001]